MLSQSQHPPLLYLIAVIAVMTAWLSLGAYAWASGDANRANCAEFPATEVSPGFRSDLPDCRAYELVSPPYEGGQPALWYLNEPPPMSADGEHLLGLDSAGFAGAENLEQEAFDIGAVYEFSRTPFGWSTESLEPPASLAARRDFLTASADLSRSLWELVNQSNGGEEIAVPESYRFAIREVPAAGQVAFAGVGPADSPQGGHELHVTAASRDLGHIVLEGVAPAGSQLWPGDETHEGDASLYEYVGTGNREPTLVGVSNAGPLQSTKYVNEDAKLVSECGTVLGSKGEGSVYNAISANGSIVYFTALHTEGCSGSQPKVTELYARINASTTVDVSEPALTPAREEECSGVCREAENEEGVNTRSPARFEGASEDGSKVFFSTEQPLLNSDRDSTRDLYEAEVGEGGVTKLVQVSAGDETDQTRGSGAEVTTVVRISEDGSHVYYVAKGALTTKPNMTGERAEAGAYNLYVYDTNTDRTAFVANLMTVAEAQAIVKQATDERNSAIEGYKEGEEAECERFREEGRTERAEECETEVEAEVKRRREAVPGEVAETLAQQGESRTGATSKDDDRPFETTRNGRFLVFVNARHLTGAEDTGTARQIFEYDAQEQKLLRVAIGQCPVPTSACAPAERFNDNGNTTNDNMAPRLLTTPQYENKMQPTDASSGLAVSEDGAVVFTSAYALTPSSVDGTEGRENVYVYRDGEVYLVSAGDEAAPLRTEMQRLLGADQSGNDVFFFTTDSLVPQDTDTQSSWYDARVGGGFPAPPSSTGCVGGACQGPSSALPPVSSASGSATQTPGENLPPAVTKAATKPAPEPLTRAQKLAKSQKACKKKSKKKRSSCEHEARKKYGAKKPSRKKGHR